MSVRIAPAVYVPIQPESFGGWVKRIDCGLQLRFEPPLDQHLQSLVVDVDVAIGRIAAELHVGRIADAALETLRSAPR